MVRLEELVSGSRVKGIVGRDFVEVLAARSFGPDAVEITYKHNGAVDQTILYRSNEADLELASVARRFAFDGNGHLFRLASEALRIRLAHLFDPFLAVRSAQIDALPHQLTAVYEEMLPRQPLRFLLADDPGAGKTIMAGLFIKELLIRGDLERCLIVAPGSLVEQWQDELHEKFDLRFDILTRDQIEASATGNFFSEKQRVIARLDMLARSDDLRARLQATPMWDLIICDEAHRMSASFFGGEVKYTKRYQLGQLLGTLTHNLLLMTATPHNGKQEDFELFMGLLDADRFEGRQRQGARTVDPSDMMRRLTKEELKRFDGSPLFPERFAHTISYKLSEREAVLYEAVTRYVREEMNRADKIENGGEKRRNTVGFALQILQRRLASSPAAIHESLKRRLARLEARLEEERLLKRGRDGAALSAPDVPVWDEEDLEEAPEDEIEEIEDEVVDQATAARTVPELEAEIASLRELEGLARALRRSGDDTKWRELDSILDDPLVYNPDNDIRRKIVIFTEARDTLEYLAARIRSRTGEEESVVVIHGGVPRDRRRAAIASFNDDPKVRFLIANDAAGEGVNLQRGAHLMVNYDLPWNPNRLEQRFGRVHRIGQTEVCHLWNLIAGETREGQVYERLLEKLETARATLGGKVYDVLGELFEAKALREMLMEAVRYGERPDVKARLFQAIDGAVDRERIEQLVARSKLTKEGLDAATINALREEMERAEARRLQPRYIRSFFEEAFDHAGGKMHQRETDRFEVTRVPGILRDRDRLIGRGDPVLPRYERICFDKKDVATGKHQAALLAPGHPLLDAVIDLTLERYRTLLSQGTVLIDENDNGTEPRVLVYLEHGIRDGRVGRNGRPNLVSQRLQFVFVDQAGRTVDGGAAPYLDYRPATPDEWTAIDGILMDGWLTGSIEDQARGYAIANLVPRHLEEVRSRRLQEIERIEEAVKERLRREILHWQHRALELEREEQAGKQQRLNSQYARRQVDALTDRLERRLDELHKERAVAPLPPEVQGAALVVPVGWLRTNTRLPTPPEATAEDRSVIEQLAMAAVMAAERNLGREPSDVSAENRGYDIESREAGSGKLHFIEVKGRHEAADTVTITRNELLTALNAEHAYVLAVVRVQSGAAQLPVYLRNPSPLFGSEPGFAEVSRTVNLTKLLFEGGPPH